MKIILSILLSSFCLSAFGAKAEIQQATVTLPYSELLGLLKQANAGQNKDTEVPPKPPVDVVVQSAVYTIDCTDPGAATLDASFSVTNLSDEWQAVFLVEATEAIRALDPPDAKLVQMDGGMSLLLEPKASAIIKIGLQAEQAMHSQSGQLIADFYAVGAAQSLLKVTHGSDPAALIVTGAVGANREKTEFSLPASGGSVQVKLYEPEAIEPTIWSASAKHWIRDLGGVIEVACHLRLNATDGGLTSRAKLLLASPASVSAVTNFGAGAGPRDSIEMTGEGPVLHLEWPHDAAMAREVMVKYSVPVALADGRFTVPLLRVSGAAQMDAACYVSDFDGIEVKPVEGRWLGLGRLPDWIGQEARAETLNYMTVSDRDRLELSARLLPRLKTAPATVQMAEYFTELVAEGGMLHKAEVTIEHVEAAEYIFKLPDGGKLLSCTLNGRSTEPLLAEDGGLIFNLPKANGQHSRSVVGYVFTTKGEKMNPVEGKAQLELPRTPLFIHKISWLVQLPEEYQATALEGNVVIDTGGAPGKTVHLSKQICDDETPFASLYYTRKDLNR
jgi:hypothetical protein